MQLTRKSIAKYLDLSIRSTYRIWQSNHLVLTSRMIVDYLNEHRVNNQPRITEDFVPHLRSVSTQASTYGVTPRRVRSWIAELGAPAFKVGKTFRVEPHLFDQWFAYANAHKRDVRLHQLQQR